MTRIFTTLFALLMAGSLFAQYTSPDEGLTFGFDYLVANSNGAVTLVDGEYYFNESITIAPTDTLSEESTETVKVAANVLITIQGGLFLHGVSGFTFTWQNTGEHYEGFRFEEGSVVELRRLHIINGGGIRVLTEDFGMYNCYIGNHETLASTGGALGLSRGKPQIIECVFENNVSAAINSAANGEVAPNIVECMFFKNGTGVVNKAQINLGPSGSDTTMIISCYIDGAPENYLSGGIAFTSLLGVEGHAIIEDNEVFENRYGIAVIGGNLTSRIANNLVYNNNIQDDPMQGGSGINLYGSGSNHAVLSGNEIYGNLWGMTMQGSATANLGDTSATNYNAGMNIFYNNGNGGVTYALFNNTPNDVMAMNNCWDGYDNELTPAEAEELISHQADDAELGLVTYTPLGMCSTVGTAETNPKQAVGYPNPTTDLLTIETADEILGAELFDVNGRKVLTSTFSTQSFTQNLSLQNLENGIYIARILTRSGEQKIRIIKQ